MMEEVAKPTRAEALAEVRARLSAAFPHAEISTNDDANPATPYMARLSWGNQRIVKVVRADSPTWTVAQFLNRAVPLIEKFQQDNVPSRHMA